MSLGRKDKLYTHPYVKRACSYEVGKVGVRHSFTNLCHRFKESICWKV